MIDDGDIPSIQCKLRLRGPKSMRKVNGLSLVLTFPFRSSYHDSLAVRPRCNFLRTQPSLPSVTYIQVSSAKRSRVRPEPCVGQSVLVSSTHPGPKTRFLSLSDSCGFADMGRPLWREDKSVVYNSCWPSLAQSFLGPIFYCLRFETPQKWTTRSQYLYPPGTGWPVTLPGTGLPFRRLLRLEGLWWRYSNQPTRRGFKD
jgi:hypothetical protein